MEDFRSMPRLLTIITVLVSCSPLLRADEVAAAAKTEEYFEQRIRPVLANVCFRCHGGERVSGGLRVDSREALLAGGDSGPAIEPGQPDSSLLLKAIARSPEVSAMPPAADAQLSNDQIRDFRLWITAGAFWPERVEPFEIQQHWAFQPLSTVAVPDSSDSPWVQNPVDAFVLSRMQQSGVAPAAPADRRTLIRRVTFDLTGLPPAPGDVAAFLNDRSPDAFTRVIDRLLASPAYGEKWGRHWLDVVRYADTAGETADYPVPAAWRYRNYVIDAFNEDLPYNQFVREQLAGDLLAAEQPDERFAARTIATGFLAVSRRFGFDSENYHHLTIQDTIDTVGQTFLGLTLGCARCHDHKFDPVSTRDYYALYGIFDSSRYPFPGSEQKQRVRALTPLCPPAEAQSAWHTYLQRTQQIAARLTELQQPVPSAVLRLTTDIDGDFELQAPAAGGSYGVLVPPWRYSGNVSVTAAAQSPFHNVYPGGSRGAAVPPHAGRWSIWQALHLPADESAQTVCLNIDLRIAAAAAPGAESTAPRLTLASASGSKQLTLTFHAGRILQTRNASQQQLGSYRPGEWFNLQLTLHPATGAISGRVGTPEATAEFQATTPAWDAPPERLELAGEATAAAEAAGVEVDQIAIRQTAFPPVSNEFQLPSETPSGESAAAARQELEAAIGIDGDLELQPSDGAPAAPWNPGPNSVVRLSPRSQSPFTNCYPPGQQGFHLPSRSEYDGFGLTIRQLPADANGLIHAGFDFRVQPAAGPGSGSWRYYLGHGPGSSAAVELFFTHDQLFCREGEQIQPLLKLQPGLWQQLQLTLDTINRRFSGKLLADGSRQNFTGRFSAGWDGHIDYSFIDSYGHLPGQRPELDADNFVLSSRPAEPLDSKAPASESVAERRERIQRLQRLIGDQQAETAALTAELQQLLAEGPLPLAFAMSEGTPEDARIQLRGEPTQPGDTVPRGFITVLGQAVPAEPLRGSGRRELADWLVRPDNPLTARVMVNRIWQQHFGRGLVATPNDFGVRGLPPSHPELLDWLAGEFMRQGWSVKAMHRLILNSAVWQQASWSGAEMLQGTDDGAGSGEQIPGSASNRSPLSTDPQTLLIGSIRRRLTAEEIRDSILAVTGQLDHSPATGHPFPAPISWGFSQHAPFSDVYEHSQRSIYLMTPRLKRHPFLALFDGADPSASTASRPGTTVPTQALFFLNDPLVHRAAERWADYLLQSSADRQELLRQAWQQALQRDPEPEELVAAAAFLETYRARLPADTPADAARSQPLAALLRTLLGSNEFLHVD
jgi:cytochrome c553